MGDVIVKYILPYIFRGDMAAGTIAVAVGIYVIIKNHKLKNNCLDTIGTRLTTIESKIDKFETEQIAQGKAIAEIEGRLKNG